VVGLGWVGLIPVDLICLNGWAFRSSLREEALDECFKAYHGYLRYGPADAWETLHDMVSDGADQPLPR